jgi:hypothetical protein
MKIADEAGKPDTGNTVQRSKDDLNRWIRTGAEYILEGALRGKIPVPRDQHG